MSPELPPFLGAWGPAAIAAAAVLGVLFGWLVPLRTHKRELARTDKELADKDAQIKTWQDAWRLSDARADLISEQNAKLLVGVETTNAILLAWQQRGLDPRATKEPA